MFADTNIIAYSTIYSDAKKEVITTLFNKFYSKKSKDSYCIKMITIYIIKMLDIIFVYMIET